MFWQSCMVLFLLKEISQRVLFCSEKNLSLQNVALCYKFMWTCQMVGGRPFNPETCLGHPSSCLKVRMVELCDGQVVWPLKAHNFGVFVVWQGCFFIHYCPTTSTANLVQNFTGLLFLGMLRYKFLLYKQKNPCLVKSDCRPRLHSIVVLSNKQLKYQSQAMYMTWNFGQYHV